MPLFQEQYVDGRASGEDPEGLGGPELDHFQQTWRGRGKGDKTGEKLNIKS